MLPRAPGTQPCAAARGGDLPLTILGECVDESAESAPISNAPGSTTRRTSVRRQPVRFSANRDGKRRTCRVRSSTSHDAADATAERNSPPYGPRPAVAQLRVVQSEFGIARLAPPRRFRGCGVSTRRQSPQLILADSTRSAITGIDADLMCGSCWVRRASLRPANASRQTGRRSPRHIGRRAPHSPHTLVSFVQLNRPRVLDQALDPDSKRSSRWRRRPTAAASAITRAA